MTKILVDREVLQAAVEILATLMHCVPSNEPELRRDTSAMAHSIRTLLDRPDAPEVSPLIVKGALTGMVDAVIRATYPTGLKEQQ